MSMSATDLRTAAVAAVIQQWLEAHGDDLDPAMGGTLTVNWGPGGAATPQIQYTKFYPRGARP